MKYKTEWVPKGWGGEKIIVNNESYCGKILYMMKDHKCSVHYHVNKKETFWLSKGKIKLLYSDEFDKIVNNHDGKGVLVLGETRIPLESAMEVEILSPGDKFEIPQKRIHRMIALEDSELFEFSTHHEDNDSFRILKGD